MMSMKTSRPPGKKASMMMAGPDVKETKRQQKASERKNKDDKMKKATAEKEKEHHKELDDRSGAEAELLLQEQNTEATAETMAEEEAVMKRNTLKILNTALATIRTEATNRQAAAITSGFVQDLIAAQVLPVGSEYLAVDPKKIHRAREEVMRKVQSREEREIQDYHDRFKNHQDEGPRLQSRHQEVLHIHPEEGYIHHD